jgi:ribonucleoside-triphosphate reductase (formate)
MQVPKTIKEETPQLIKNFTKSDKDFQIQKRDGTVLKFDLKKIENAILRAIKATGEDESTAKESASRISLQIYSQLIDSLYDKVPNIEEIQDLVERFLIKNDMEEASKAYILYRYKRELARKQKNISVEVQQTISEYLDKLDWRVQANSNQGYSLGGMILNTAGKVTANYWLSYIYPKEVGEAHRNADLHIHDLDMFSGYCAGWSLRTLLEEGLNGVPEKVESAPPKHLSSALAQMVNFLGTLQNEWAGAQAFSSFDTLLAPFVKKYSIELELEIDDNEIKFNSQEARKKYINKKTYQYVFQNIQAFVFNLNIPSRWGTQTPFTNITLDWNCPKDLEEQRLKLGGKPFEYKFSELQKEMDMINHAYIEVMTAGDSKGRTFTFPIPTYNIVKDFDWQDPKNTALFEMTAKYGTPYFQNFINSDLNPGDVRSMCCRLQLDLNELKKRGGGLFGSAEMTGSIGVVTLSLARIGYTCKADKQAFFKRIDYLMELAKSSLEIKRKEIQKWIDRGLFPYTKRYLMTLRNHFSTIGINGVNEAILNFTEGDFDITTEYGQNFAKEILDHVRNKLVDFQEETGNLYNLEATPAEGATYRFAKEDQKRFPDIIQAGSPEAPFYTNSSQIPVAYTSDVFEALELQNDLQTRYTGGTVFHAYMNERLSNSESCKNLVKKILENYKIPYLTITPTFSICPNHGYLEGEYEFCPKCEEENQLKGSEAEPVKCEIWTRVMGYHRPVSNFNVGKKSEHKERRHFQEIGCAKPI